MKTLDDLLQYAEQAVTTIRAQNWKNGGVMAVDHDEAVALVKSIVKAAYAFGDAHGSHEAGERMLRVFDKSAA